MGEWRTKIEDRVEIDADLLNYHLRKRNWNHEHIAPYFRKTKWALFDWNRTGWPRNHFDGLVLLLGLDELEAEELML